MNRRVAAGPPYPHVDETDFDKDLWHNFINRRAINLACAPPRTHALPLSRRHPAGGPSLLQKQQQQQQQQALGGVGLVPLIALILKGLCAAPSRPTSGRRQVRETENSD